ncbi:MAG: RNA polymerase sigma factor [Gorillibacterium sp.]|nr:RNA polymerase sigma factor [Gorillibacterium sp.]
MENEYLKSITKLDSPEIETLVKQYWHDVWQYAFFLTRQEHMADDIAQDTFIRAFRSIASFRGQCEVKTWLFKIARNTAYNYKKSAFLKKVTLRGLLFETKAAPSAETEYFNRSMTNDLWSAVLRLPPKDREILILHAHYELSHMELTELLGIAEGTVKSRIHRARARLAREMKEEDGHAETDIR